MLLAPRILVVREGRIRPDEHIVRDSQAVPELDAALDRHAVADDDVVLDEHVVADVAVARRSWRQAGRVRRPRRACCCRLTASRKAPAGARRRRSRTVVCLTSDVADPTVPALTGQPHAEMRAGAHRSFAVPIQLALAAILRPGAGPAMRFDRGAARHRPEPVGVRRAGPRARPTALSRRVGAATARNLLDLPGGLPNPRLVFGDGGVAGHPGLRGHDHGAVGDGPPPRRAHGGRHDGCAVRRPDDAGLALSLRRISRAERL